MVLFEKFGQHQPLNRQAERYAKEGVPISLSTLADQVGGCTAVLMPLFKRLEAYVLSAERLHGDDTKVPVLAKGKTDTGRIWVYVRDDKPFGGPPSLVGNQWQNDSRARQYLVQLASRFHQKLRRGIGLCMQSPLSQGTSADIQNSKVFDKLALYTIGLSPKALDQILRLHVRTL
jgi:hypothetical protein